MQFDTEATICGIATGQQPSSRGAVRVSGQATHSVLASACEAFTFPTGSSRAQRLPVTWNLGEPFGELDVDIWYWPTSRSYTGMPSAELHTIGHPLLLQRMVEQLCRAGARLAIPGEFTLRAFLAGRMDLTQCEAVLGVIEAKSAKALDVALRQLAGGLSQPLQSLRKNLVELLADIEAGLDFVDEDIEFISQADIQKRLQLAQSQIAALLSQLQQRRAANEVAKVVLVGLPNAGKSSLFNALLGQSAAIVHNQAGTTRDFIRERLQLEHGAIELIDTAGFEATEAVGLRKSIESSAQSHRLEQSEQADLVLYCVDQSSDFDPSFRPSDTEVWLIQTKCDDEKSPSTVALKPSSASCRVIANNQHTPSSDPILTSSHTRLGLDELLGRLNAWLSQRTDEQTSVAPLTATRCVSLLEAAAESLKAAVAAVDHHHGDEIVSGELRLALDALGQVAGEVYTDDILDALFSRFCIGK